jgi:hypothetical protein
VAELERLRVGQSDHRRRVEAHAGRQALRQVLELRARGDHRWCRWTTAPPTWRCWQPGCAGTRGIENRVHHVRDVTQREDASRIQTGNAAQVMAALPNTAANLARLDGYDNIAAAQRAAAWYSTAITDALNTA